MPSIRVATTAALAADELAEIRAILDEAFAGDFSDHDWDHALGGVHALAYEDDELVGHGSVVERLLEHDGMPLRTGYVEGMGVRVSHRRRGHGDAIMAVLEEEIRARFQLGALAATDDGAGLYLSRGWVRWTGPTYPDAERALFVLPLAVPVDPRGTLRADRRDGDIW
jgi:aminoglycoside 2'-N-acetyltransferase I